MLCGVLRTLYFLLCISMISAKSSLTKHKVAKRWAYIENGDPQMRSIHTDCKQIVREYSEGELPFYEYTAKMKKCMDRQQRTNIPSYEDSDFFTPSFNLPNTQSSKRFETPDNYQQPRQQPINQYGGNTQSYAATNYQYPYGTVDQRDDIASSPQAPQYQATQEQSYQASPPANYYQETRNEVPSYQSGTTATPSMYSDTIVKKDVIPRPNAYY